MYSQTVNFNAKLFVQEEYDLRILFDANKNGIWDPGILWQHTAKQKSKMPVPT